MIFIVVIFVTLCFVNFQPNSVSLAYFLGPLLGGEISQYIGFSWLMSIIGLANIFYGIYLIRTVLCVEVCNFISFASHSMCLNWACAFVFLLHRVTLTKRRLAETEDPSCVCGHRIPPYRAITSDSMTPWISLSNSVRMISIRTVETPIKFSFHTWLTSNSLSARLHSYRMPHGLQTLFRGIVLNISRFVPCDWIDGTTLLAQNVLFEKAQLARFSFFFY